MSEKLIPTPRTDALIDAQNETDVGLSEGWHQLRDLARQLERELAEARSAITPALTHKEVAHLFEVIEDSGVPLQDELWAKLEAIAKLDADAARSVTAIPTYLDGLRAALKVCEDEEEGSRATCSDDWQSGALMCQGEIQKLIDSAPVSSTTERKDG